MTTGILNNLQLKSAEETTEAGMPPIPEKGVMEQYLELEAKVREFHQLMQGEGYEARPDVKDFLQEKAALLLNAVEE